MLEGSDLEAGQKVAWGIKFWSQAMSGHRGKPGGVVCGC